MLWVSIRAGHSAKANIHVKTIGTGTRNRPMISIPGITQKIDGAQGAAAHHQSIPARCRIRTVSQAATPI